MTAPGETTRLLVVRHGATTWSEGGRLNGRSDIPLSEVGRAQVRELARTLDPRPQTTIWSSDLERATATASILQAAVTVAGAVLPLRIDERLRELDFGRLEGLTWTELEPATRRALFDFDGFSAPGGESVLALAARVDDFLTDLHHVDDPGPQIVVTHGGVIRLLLRRGPGDRPVRPGQAIRLTLAAGSVQAG